MTNLNAALVGWSGVATSWWLLAVLLVACNRRKNRVPNTDSARESHLEALDSSPARSPVPAASEHRPETSAPRIATRVDAPQSRPTGIQEASPSLTVFKPLPPVADEAGGAALRAAVESFIAQLGETDELILGIPQDLAAIWRPTVVRWREQFPSAHIIECCQASPRHHANPKVAWLEVLAPRAQGDCWVWSDADIIASPGLLNALREELEAHDAGAVTTAYCVRQVLAAPGLLDALFVNTDFLPGARLLGWLGPVRLSFGAAVIFRASEFQQKVRWTDLGTCLADDYALGQYLAPVVISTELVETCALQTRWSDALRHLHRWQKTIRWCRPGSFAALLFIMPLFGWLLRCAWAPTDPLSWLGLSAQWGVEAVTAGLILATLRFRSLGRHLWIVALWPGIRLVGWISGWLPIPVMWERNPWRTPRQASESSSPFASAKPDYEPRPKSEAVQRES